MRRAPTNRDDLCGSFVQIRRTAGRRRALATPPGYYRAQMVLERLRAVCGSRACGSTRPSGCWDLARGFVALLPEEPTGISRWPTAGPYLGTGELTTARGVSACAPDAPAGVRADERRSGCCVCSRRAVASPTQPRLLPRFSVRSGLLSLCHRLLARPCRGRVGHNPVGPRLPRGAGSAAVVSVVRLPCAIGGPVWSTLRRQSPPCAMASYPPLPSPVSVRAPIARRRRDLAAQVPRCSGHRGLTSKAYTRRACCTPPAIASPPPCDMSSVSVHRCAPVVHPHAAPARRPWISPAQLLRRTPLADHQPLAAPSPVRTDFLPPSRWCLVGRTRSPAAHSPPILPPGSAPRV